MALDFTNEMPNQFISGDEERSLNPRSFNTGENPQSSEGVEVYDAGSAGPVSDVPHDQLPNVESYKAMMGYRPSPSAEKKPAGMMKKNNKIIKKLAKRMSATTAIDMTDTSEGSLTEEEAVKPYAPPLDPPEQYSGNWGGLMKDPSGETFVDDYCDEEEEHDGQHRNLVHTDKPADLARPTPRNLFRWKLVSLITIGALLAVLAVSVIMLISNSMNSSSWSKEQGGSDDSIHTGKFVRGKTKEYWAVCNYLLNIGILPYNRTYDNNNYDPDSIEAVPTTSEPQPLARRDALLNETSPQYLAAQWLAHGDHHAASSSSLKKSVVPTINHKEYNQRYAMAVIYFALGGNEWTRNYNFMSSGHICTWKEEYNLQEVAEAATSSGSNAELASLVDLVHHGNGWESTGDGQTMIIHGVHDCVKDAEGNFYPKALYLPHNNLQGRIPDEIGILNDVECRI
mmetsp:Transcript_1390/g.2732  ORF Transcript_1390/g.2732 Transcript_1390/m.2732 type:complete len:454 (-) Transcript_1390:1180-2541(-)